MKERKHKLIIFILLFAMMIPLLQPFCITETYQAASSYDDAKMFFESTGQTNGKHIECNQGMIYFATKAKMASSSTAKRYTSVGFDVTLTGNGASLTFAVKRGASLTELLHAKREVGGYRYILYRISTEDLYRLASGVDQAAANRIFSADEFRVRMNAIMTIKKNGVDQGAIVENGNGTISVVSNPIYHLNNTSDLRTLKSMFNTDFESFTNIDAPLINHKLNIYYSLGDGVTASNGYYPATFYAGSKVIPNALHLGGGVVRDAFNITQWFHLQNPYALGLSKTGYHLVAGREWVRDNGMVFPASSSYMPKYIVPEVANGNANAILYANWEPNAYSVYYHANGGSGWVAPTDFRYDQKKNLSYNTFYRTGYRLKYGQEWNTSPDGTGTIFASAQEVWNLTVGTEPINLYANWEPNVYSITLNQQGGSGGTTVIYQKYGVGFFFDEACTQPISNVTSSGKAGYNFEGYYSSVNGGGTQIIDKNGNLKVGNTHYTSNATIYAHFTPKEYQITFDKQGGKYGTDSAKVFYLDYFPTANTPVRSGYTFKGYYTSANGKGTQCYNENMASGKTYTYTQNINLYAYWVDETVPSVTLKTNIGTWTNQKITLTADASDYGTGLKSIAIYQVADNGALTLVAQNNKCNGAQTISLAYTNPTEGVIRYKAVATDHAGNSAEAYNVAYYDITPPKAEILNNTVNGNSVFFKINITDVRVN